MTGPCCCKLTKHAQISQCNTLLPEALSSLDDNGCWHNTGPNPVAMRTLFLDFQSLHHMNVVHVQDQLVKECNKMITSKTSNAEQMEKVKLLLRDHSEAVRNWDSVVMRPIVRDGFGPGEKWRAAMTYRYLSHWDNPVSSRLSSRLNRIFKRKTVQALSQRFSMALLGGVALVVPMLVMTLHPTQAKSLVTTCVAVFVFALAMAIASKATPENVLGVTAAYAALLVVFVGSAQTGNTG